jgi:starch synthase (maltosyl-transferring)
MKRETTPIGAKAPKGKTQTASESTSPPRTETKAPARKRSLPPPEPPLSFAPATVAPDVPAPADGSDGRIRAVIGAVLPSVDEGRFPVKAIVGQRTTITAHCFTDGHDVLRVMLRWRPEASNGARDAVRELPMRALGNDVWEAAFAPPAIGRYLYSVSAWVDSFESWRHEMARRVGEDIRIAALAAAKDIVAAAGRADGTDREALARWGEELARAAADGATELRAVQALALDATLAEVARRHPDRSLAVTSAELPLWAQRTRAGFSTWYELFPRSASSEPGRHGTFRDVETRLPAIAAMGFDVLYMPPIHPIGREQRKGPNNTLVAGPDDVGSPWAIGAREGGHKSILPALGTPEDFRHLVQAANAQGIEIALDIAFQCAPDHPYVKEHPEWFRRRPDGSVQYAENPPKKYQDIYPFHFESDDWRALWAELKSVLDHWIGEGVRIFRVDNPHTKSFAFWQWAIGEVNREHPEVIFLAEAFTRPKVMHRLAKLGFTQSYTYFTWRTGKAELVEYFTELSSGPGADYFRPNAWPNTPDILHEQLQAGDAPTYMARLVLAATLAGSYGIYGPAYELREHRPREHGSEEYLDSEKYQLRHWNHDDPESLAPFIARVNRIRHDNPALQTHRGVRFLPVENDMLLAYARESVPDNDEAEANVVIVAVNLDPHQVHSGWIHLDPASIGVGPDEEFQVHDLLTNQRYTWRGHHHYVKLDPHSVPAHILVVRRRVRSERDFDYFL